MTEAAMVRTTMQTVINRVLTQSGREARAFRDDDTLTGTIGLDSLDLAAVVVRLEKELGFDPFRSGSHAVHTFGELVALYENTDRGEA